MHAQSYRYITCIVATTNTRDHMCVLSINQSDKHIHVNHDVRSSPSNNDNENNDSTIITIQQSKY